MNQGTILGSQIGKWIILAVVVAAFAALLTASVVRAQELDGSIEYAEDRTDPVATFMATDPEGDTVTWSLEGDDEQDFDISEDGVLTFDVGGDNDNPDASVSPDFESPGDTGVNNIYEVTVTASSDDGEGSTNTDMEEVTVEVTDVAEDGEVTWTVAVDTHTAGDTLLTQFIVGADLEATVTDGDGIASDTERYQWYRSSSKSSQGTPIDNPSADPEDYTVVPDDVGSYIRVVAYYYEERDPIQKSEYLVSDHRVLGTAPAGNEAPEFDPTTVAREVNEGDSGMAVGGRVTATGGHGVLVYTLTGTDADEFEIDRKTGQIKTMVDLDYEATGGGDNQCTTANECVVTVMATDAAGRDSAVATVNIEINSVDEKPYFDAADTPGIQDPEAEVDRAEGADTVDATGAVYTAYDPDMGSVNYALMGTDGNLFTLNNEQMLRFKTAPDHENPMDRNRDNVYEVTVRATDGTMHADLMVEVTVTDVNEDPMIEELDGSIEYAEDRTDPVATFMATDPEGDTVTWSLEGDDEQDFDISEDGVLTFDVGGDNDNPDASVSPDFESPGDTGVNNIYEVTVTASSDDGEGSTNTDMEEVTVEVTDVAEDGEVTWTVAVDTHTAGDTLLTQFIVGADLEATVTDGDGIASGTERYQWYRSSSKSSQGTPIDNPSTDPEDYTVVPDDVGSYIRVVVWYAETATPTKQKSEYLVSDHQVLGTAPAGNEAPEFDPTTVAREVNEGDSGMAVGGRVTATGGHGVLVYTLTGTDADEFEIDRKTGQIKTMVDLDYEATGGGDNQCTTANECVVTVMATDAAGRDSAVATVNIEINSVDEKPYFDAADTPGIQDPEAEVDRAEGADTVDATGAVYTAYDPDMGSVNYALMGTDGNLFTLNNEQMLRFKTAPDHENPMDRNGDNVYEVTVRATDGTMHADLMVEVTVTDVNEDPMIVRDGLAVSGPSSENFYEDDPDPVAMFTARGPMKEMASWTLEGDDSRYFSVDPARGAMTELMFQSAPDYEMPRGMAMSDTNTNTYKVTLKANDGTHMDTHDVTVTVTNVDELGTLSGDSSHRYEEGGDGAVGTYAASGGSMSDVANWSLMGDDMGDLSISSSGVLTFDAMPNYEMPMDEGMDNIYEVTVMAEAGGEMDEIMVTVAVTNVDELGTLSGDSSHSYEEGGDGAVGTYAVSGGSMSDVANWSLMGDDMGDLSISSSGVLTFDAMPNYEMPMDEGMDNIYEVTVKAEAGGEMDEIMVTVAVGNMEEPGTVTLMPMDPRVDTEIRADLTDEDGVTPGTVTWQWSRSMTMGGAFTDIDEATMMTYTPMATDGGYYLRATATYTDGYGDDTAMATTTSAVGANRAPIFAAATATREVAEDTAAGMNIGAPVTATDPDGDTLTYSLSGTDEASFDIGESTGQLMTKAALDYETKMSYMVTVTATDPDGLTDTIDVTINVTEVDEGPVQRYDGNDDGEIDIGELFVAIDAYFDGEISITELFEVIDAYFAG